ncbi:MAG: HD-GYP domain-containing protein [Nitrospinota bacterium]
MKGTIYHSGALDLSEFHSILAQEGIELKEVSSLEGEDFSGEGFKLLLLDRALMGRNGHEGLASFLEGPGQRTLLVVNGSGERDLAEELPPETIFFSLDFPFRRRQFLLAVKSAFQHLLTRAATEGQQRQIKHLSSEMQNLHRIGMALSAERDLNNLLNLILTLSREATDSDAGSLYLVEGLDGEEGERRLRFMVAQNDSVESLLFTQYTIPVDRKSLAGYAAVTGETLNIEDVYELPPGVEYSFNPSFDKRLGYRTRSMLTVPMVDHKDRIIGVLQLINRKRDKAIRLKEMDDFENFVIPYDKKEEALVRSLASQAAVCVENDRLYANINRLFEGFIKASVTAIEQRDPATSGHSARVSLMTVGLAELIDRISMGRWKNVQFTPEQIREIRYAALLHDFGKVGVREHILVKGKKLYPLELELVNSRFDFIRRSLELEFAQRKLQQILLLGEEGAEEALAQLELEFKARQEEVERFRQLVIEANEPTILAQEHFREVLRIARQTYRDLEGQEQPFLTENEVFNLSIPMGTLNIHERHEIESHVIHTFHFLSKIPWTTDLAQIPIIAYGHHEKVNGTGYPRGITGPEIPLQTKMMTVADIFDALTASDHPYKRAVSVEHALDILKMEVKEEQLDGDLVGLFIEEKIYQAARDYKP